MWHRDTKWANDIEKNNASGLAWGRVATNHQFMLKKNQYLKQNKVKHNKKKYLCKLQPKPQLTLEAYCTGLTKAS